MAFSGICGSLGGSRSGRGPREHTRPPIAFTTGEPYYIPALTSVLDSFSTLSPARSSVLVVDRFEERLEFVAQQFEDAFALRCAREVGIADRTARGVLLERPVHRQRAALEESFVLRS